MPDTVAAYIALGSNLGDRAAHLRAGLNGLAGLSGTMLTASSTIIQTEPVAAAGALPSDAGGPYLNAVAALRTSLLPRDLLDALLAIELSRGRQRSAGRQWQPRTLDLDLLLYGDQSIDEPGLTVPHPRLHERRFVLEPLAELAPGLVVPTLGKPVAELLAIALRSVAA